LHGHAIVYYLTVICKKQRVGCTKAEREKEARLHRYVDAICNKCRATTDDLPRKGDFLGDDIIEQTVLCDNENCTLIVRLLIKKSLFLLFQYL